MACRWLAAECRRYGLEWKNVTAAMFEQARADHSLEEVFQLEGPGIVLFDDFDNALRHREDSVDASMQSTFLTELDGMESKEGIVYLFTSNLPRSQLDPAMARPGRIDVFLYFAPPDSSLRLRFLLEHWPAEGLLSIDVEEVAAETDGLSFAELDEAKKLLVLRHMDEGRWDWPWVREELGRRRSGARKSRRIGFGSDHSWELPQSAPCA